MKIIDSNKLTWKEVMLGNTEAPPYEIACTPNGRRRCNWPFKSWHYFYSNEDSCACTRVYRNSSDPELIGIFF